MGREPAPAKRATEVFSAVAACALVVFGIARALPAAQEASKVSGQAEAASTWAGTLQRRLSSARETHARLIRLRGNEHRELVALRRAAASGFAAVRARGSDQGVRGGTLTGGEDGARAARRERRKVSGGWYFVGVDWRDGLPVLGTYSKLDPGSWEAYWIENGEVYYRETS
ncbi:MAG TPA: hypothetical protein VFG93_00545 [Gaiellaceae bacterium]|nr:hypothetical protein [Gaiellaceae bacterium]